MDNNQIPSDEENNLDYFFEMFDCIEEDITELAAEGANEIGGYECLYISFHNLRMFCRSIGLDFEQIEDQYRATQNTPSGEEFWDIDLEKVAGETDEVMGFYKILEKAEESFSVFEQRCQKSGEPFDEWACVLILFSYLTKYSEAMKINYKELQQAVSELHSKIEKMDADSHEPGEN